MDIILPLLLAALGGDPNVGPSLSALEPACLDGSGITDLTACMANSQLSQSCAMKTTYAEKQRCGCSQELLSSYHNCKSEIYDCIGMPILDPVLDQQIRAWHATCDSYLNNAPITTPPARIRTRTYNLADCNRLAGSCYSADYETNLCSRRWLPASSVSYVSCACQPPIYSLISECMYNGNVSCKLETAHESNIMGHRECSYFWTGSETLPPVDMTSFLSLENHAAIVTAADLQAIARVANAAPKETGDAKRLRIQPDAQAPFGDRDGVN